ncbi:DUF6525 family protein [Phaeovulum vinaykumarii]|uniref:Uncharacterized protein n=1 Tax=Phaeovulum vinaykumarii TaxID=407234 RepID=A0A1N7LAN4_9RHOB|nr:DUF6525 family protein [Phaeovulum vinaykumarii]SIS70935.1 hypothetical protein SAMN05421795_102769 [Phaeovulum vinaykumarii]SOB98642.1 hypothetical protein SAMN05878426_1023 [Phaeovulum vinaykumarii]
MRRNLSTRLRARRRENPMAAHDRLPAPARAWVAQAVLPWSAASVARIWARALAETGCEEAALARLAAAEARTLAREGGWAGKGAVGQGGAAPVPKAARSPVGRGAH